MRILSCMVMTPWRERMTSWGSRATTNYKLMKSQAGCTDQLQSCRKPRQTARANYKAAESPGRLHGPITKLRKAQAGRMGRSQSCGKPRQAAWANCNFTESGTGRTGHPDAPWDIKHGNCAIWYYIRTVRNKLVCCGLFVFLNDKRRFYKARILLHGVYDLFKFCIDLFQFFAWR